MTIIPLREIYDVPAPPPPRYTTAAHPANVIKSASRPSVVRIARSSKKLAPIPGGEPAPNNPLLLWNFLDRYCIIIGESVARSSSSPSRAGRAWKLSYPTTFGKKHRQKHGRYRVKSAIVGNEGIRFLLLR